MRNMGPESTPSLMADCARLVEGNGIGSVWITDHVAIPPDDAVGSGGRYVDPFVTLSWLAGQTTKLQLGTGVIVLPYRPPLMLARLVASAQELSGGRVLLGVGIGWMAAEFRAVGVDLRQRATYSDASLEFLNKCFAADVVEAHGQPLLFRPRPPKPPILVGGRAPHALERAARFGDGWLPMGLEPGQIAGVRAQYREFTDRVGKAAGSITVMTALPMHDVVAAQRAFDAYRAAGVDRLVCAIRYRTYTEYSTAIKRVATLRDR